MFAAPRKITHVILIAGLLLPTLAQADIDACFNFLEAQDYARAEKEAKQLLQRGTHNRIDERETQLCLGRAYNGMGRVRDALPAFQRVEALSETPTELAIAYNWLGLGYDALNDLDRAELYDQRSLKAFRELGDKKKEAVALNNLARVVQQRGDTERALKLYREALAMTPETAQATLLNNIALIHSNRKEYKQAIKLLRQAIDIERHNGDSHRTAMAQINLGKVLYEDKQYSAAEKELLAGLNAIRLLGDKAREAEACFLLGYLAVDMKKTGTDVLDWLEKAEALYREIGDTANADAIANLLAGK